MVRINSVILAGLAAVGVSARPASNAGKRQLLGDCMTAEEAQFVATNYGKLVSVYNKTLADAALAVNFTDYSESVSTLINTCPQGDAAQGLSLPLLAPTFTSREQFEIGQGQQPEINFEQLNIWPSCDAVTIRWMTNNTAPIPNPKPVVGLIAMEVVRNPDVTAALDYPWLIDYVYSEFDAGAWLQNLQEAGICGTPPADSPAIPQGPSNSSSTSAPAASNTCACAPTSGLPSPTSTAAPTSPASVTTAPTAPVSSPSAPAYGAGSSSSSSASWSWSASASSPAAYPSSSASGPGAYESSAPTPTTSEDVPTVTSTSVVTVVVGSDGSVGEEPCDEEEY